MVQERLDAAAKLLQNQGQLPQEGIRLMRHIMRSHGIIDPGPKEQAAKRPPRTSRKGEISVSPELNLEAEWQRQSQDFLNLNFHIERGFPDTEEGRKAYLDSLPKFEPQPEEYKGRLDKPMLVERKIPWRRQADLAHIAISPYLQARLKETCPWEDNPHKVSDDVVAYTGWFNEWGKGDFPDPIKPFDARKQLALDVSGGDPYEGVAQEIHFPQDTARNKYFDLIGYSVGSGSVVGLSRWGGGPGLDAYFSGPAGACWRPLIRGSRIVTK